MPNRLLSSPADVFSAATNVCYLRAANVHWRELVDAADPSVALRCRCRFAAPDWTTWASA
jgi:hypothetical protein